MADDIEKADMQEELNNTSPSPAESSSEMLKPWMKTLGKSFYKNEVLGKYDSLSDAVTDLLKRPEKKEVPDSYELRDGTDELFKKAGLTKGEAKEIDSFYSKLMPKKKTELKDAFGERYDEVMKLYADGVKGISEDLEGDIKKAGLDKDPTFVNIMARVGKETGSKPFVPPKNGGDDSNMSAAERAIRKAYGIR